MARYRITVEYDGTPFSGWQRQPSSPSVQGALEKAVSALSGEPAIVQGAGRTDAGVHATGQVAHFDMEKIVPVRTIADALNAHLRPKPVAVLACEAVSDDFNARFDAERRRYLYRIVNRRADLALQRNRAWRQASPLDADAMHRAAQRLVGHHDFTTFRDSACQAASPMRTLDRLDVGRRGDEVLIHAEARSFLHSQVRSLAGSLADVGRGRRSEGWIADILEARDRTRCGPVAPAWGLYLTEVEYSGPGRTAASPA